jgi:hypothetical protein
MEPKDKAHVKEPSTLTSEESYATLKVKEQYMIPHPRFINYYQIWMGAWIVFYMVWAVTAWWFQFRAMSYALIVPIGLTYFFGFSRFWYRIWYVNKDRFWYIQPSFADSIRKHYSFRQRIWAWVKAYAKGIKDSRRRRKAERTRPPAYRPPLERGVSGGDAGRGLLSPVRNPYVAQRKPERTDTGRDGV